MIEFAINSNEVLKIMFTTIHIKTISFLISFKSLILGFVVTKFTKPKEKFNWAS